MKLENRYIILKRKDVEQHLNEDEKITFSALCETVDEGRRDCGKESVEGLVIESDWPEFGPTLRRLATRVDLNEANEVCRRTEANNDKGR